MTLLWLIGSVAEIGIVDKRIPCKVENIIGERRSKKHPKAMLADNVKKRGADNRPDSGSGPVTLAHPMDGYSPQITRKIPGTVAINCAYIVPKFFKQRNMQRMGGGGIPTRCIMMDATECTIWS